MVSKLKRRVHYYTITQPGTICCVQYACKHTRTTVHLLLFCFFFPTVTSPSTFSFVYILSSSIFSLQHFPSPPPHQLESNPPVHAPQRLVSRPTGTAHPVVSRTPKPLPTIPGLRRSMMANVSARNDPISRTPKQVAPRARPRSIFFCFAARSVLMPRRTPAVVASSTATYAKRSTCI